jgi:GTP-binding protein
LRPAVAGCLPGQIHPRLCRGPQACYSAAVSASEPDLESVSVMSDALTTHTYARGAIAVGEALFRQPFTFMKSVPTLDWLTAADRPEVAFAGRSNVGKSSLINALTRHHGLARTSNTPGRTQELNYFQTVVTPMYLVDMPGYGFADAPKHKVEAWTKFVRDYLLGRASLRRVYVLIDSRHGIKPPDREMFAHLGEAAVTFQVLLTKTDKLNAYELAAVQHETEASIRKEAAAFPRLVATSSETGMGLDQVRAEIAEAIGFTGR